MKMSAASTLWFNYVGTIVESLSSTSTPHIFIYTKQHKLNLTKRIKDFFQIMMLPNHFWHYIMHCWNTSLLWWFIVKELLRFQQQFFFASISITKAMISTSSIWRNNFNVLSFTLKNFKQRPDSQSDKVLSTEDFQCNELHSTMQGS